ncbi:MAG: class I SAM-dependent methyltransferase [Chloroflexota bacterium]
MEDTEVQNLHQRNRRAWNVVAAVYENEVERDVADLRANRICLFDYEVRLLGELRGSCRRAIALQCSHGLDALSLWKLGATEVIGVDGSGRMLDLARRKSQLLGAPARWIECDVLEVPSELNTSADLVYTGKGSLPWVADLDRWAGVVARVLRPGGRLLLTEGHLLDWVWEPDASAFRVDQRSGGYFADQPVENRDFPRSAFIRLRTPTDHTAGPVEHQWTTAQIVNALIGVGLVLDRLEEHAQPFWNKFPSMPPGTCEALPHVLVILAHRA